MSIQLLRALASLLLTLALATPASALAWTPAAEAKQAEQGSTEDTEVVFLHGGELVPFDGTEPSWGLVPATGFATLNTDHPWGRYDGQLWQGRGLNFVTRSGVYVDSPYVIGQWAPEWGWSENRDFVEGSDLYHGAVDQPGRFGDGAFSFLGWGQSFVGLRYEAVSLKLSTENLWFGPAYENPLLWGSEAPGVPHVSLNLRKTKTDWGTFEATALLGYLTASDEAPENAYQGRRALWGLMLGYSPPTLDGLTLGATRTIISAWNQVSPLDFARLFLLSIPNDQDETDQRFSLVARYRFPEVGFELYAEWGRNDFSPSLLYVLRNPFHTAAWTAGFFHRLTVLGQDFGYGAELTELTLPLEHLNNPWGYTPGGADFYTHGILREGYTNQGQLLGAPVGNGGNKQSFKVAWYPSWGKLDLSLERWHRDASYFYSQEFRDMILQEYGDPLLWEKVVDVELSWCASISWHVGSWDLFGSWRYMKELNRYYEFENNSIQVHAELGVRRSFP